MSSEEQPRGAFAGAVPGADVSALLESSVPRALGDAALVDVIVAAERQIAHLQAIQLHAMVELGQREHYAFCGGCEAADPDDHVDHLHHPAKVVASELSPALCWAPRATDARVALAYELTDDIPAVLAALHTGRVDLRKAQAIAEATRVLDHDSQRDVAERAVDIAAVSTIRRLRRWLDAEVIKADPEAAQRRHERGRRDRHVAPPTPSGTDGIADMCLTGPAEDLAALYTAVDAAARAQRADRTPDDIRTLDQRRFDILTGLGWTGLTLSHLGCCNATCVAHPTAEAGHSPSNGTNAAAAAHRSSPRHPGTPDPGAPDPGTLDPGTPDPDTPDPGTSDTGPPESSPTAGPAPLAGQGSTAGQRSVAEPGFASVKADQPLATAHGRAATVNVTVSMATLLGLDDDPGHLEGFGPVTADVARTITGDTTLRRLLTDPADGRLLEYGRATYAPPRPLRDLVIARDRTCRFPTADTPARACDIDHRRPWSAGGTTGAGNNHALSRRFHIDKTHHGWTLEQPRPGWLTWRSPAGKSYTVPPETVGVIIDQSSAPPPGRTPGGSPTTRSASADEAGAPGHTGDPSEAGAPSQAGTPGHTGDPNVECEAGEVTLTDQPPF